MPYKTEWVEPEVVLEYRGVTVHAHYNGYDIESPSMYWYVVYPKDGDSFDWSAEDDLDETREFDIRDHARRVGMRVGEPHTGFLGDDHVEILKALIDAGILTQEGIKPEERETK